MSGGTTLARERTQVTSTDLLLGRNARLPWLDVLRGVAVALVMLRHAWPSLFPAAGIVGVTMFFALSGYLITGLIVRDFEARGNLRWGRFYAHRFLRLYPALLLVVAVFAVVEILWDPLGSRDRLGASVVIALTYLADLPFADVMSGAMTHLWSLAVEEQFYLIWPAFLLLGFMALGRAKLLRWILVAVVVLTAVCWILAFALSPADMYQLPTTWVSSMAIGAAGFVSREALVRYARPTWAWGGAVALLLMCFYPNAKDSTVTYLLMPTLIAVCTLAIVLHVERRALPVTGAIRSALRLLASLGVISYAAYLWNLPIVVWWNAATTLPAWADVLTIPITVAAAVVSWYTVEAAGRALRARFDARANARVAE